MTEEAYPAPDLPDIFPSLDAAPLLPASQDVIEEQSTASEQDASAANSGGAGDPNFGLLMAQEAQHVEPEQSVQLDMLQTLKAHPTFKGGRDEWHAMNSSLVMARNRSFSPPWKRMKLEKLSVASLFQEPLIGRYDRALSTPAPVPDPAPWP